MRPAIGLLFLCAACGGATAAAPPPRPAHAAAAASTSPDEMPAPSGSLRRSEVRAVLSAGLGAFLENVTFDVDHPVFRDRAVGDSEMCMANETSGKTQARPPCATDAKARAGRRFVGFRITELKGPRWRGIDLKPGDVITAVNGFPIEHPEQAEQAFLSLAVASELRVDYERDGRPRTLRLAIVDDP